MALDMTPDDSKQAPRSREITDQEFDRVIRNFSYHAPKPDQLPRYEAIRARARGLAVFLCEHCPESRELSLALTKLDELVMWANAAIARNE